MVGKLPVYLITVCHVDKHLPMSNNQKFYIIYLVSDILWNVDNYMLAAVLQFGLVTVAQLIVSTAVHPC